jgi:hypothetical protein
MELAANLRLRHGRRPGEDGRWEKSGDNLTSGVDQMMN